ncbi:MAG: DUF2071 domain-containing protein [Acidobacteriota bacterium]|nr:DUF2071 domain-containing protein [Acidobacteriota bacterium]
MSYAMFQRWERLLFAHWRVQALVLAPGLPSGLSLDLYDGEAWVAVTPFEITRLRLRGLPPLPGASRFPELNVRTYVTAGGKPGVWFFSLDAASAIAVFSARRLYHLPYFHARMACVRQGETVSYRSDRTGETRAEFLADYAPLGEPFRAGPGSLEEWLTARYRLYASDGRTLFRAEIEHEPWTLRRARAEIFRNTMADSAGIALAGEPLLHYSEALDVRVWWPERVQAPPA